MIVVALVLVLVITLLPGCSQLVVANSGGYVGASSTAYEDALGATSQLALGTLNLEGTADAVTEAQSAELLSPGCGDDGTRVGSRRAERCAAGGSGNGLSPDQ
ncbi:MAG TPA: hypothetical protein VM366_01865, partial [Anaerolineae bacterium]|nr:hypothetical protein [Anaerolineae bacterium]